jgi:hypothetical protein
MSDWIDEDEIVSRSNAAVAEARAIAEATRLIVEFGISLVRRSREAIPYQRPQQASKK